MTKLFVAGDSFASLLQDQPTGTGWTERLAAALNYELINVARAAASNVSIAIQLDWILDQIGADDFVVVWLTDHRRITLVRDFAIVDHRPLLTQHSPHAKQIVTTKDVYLEDSIVSGMAGKPVTLGMKHYAGRMYSERFHQFLDEYTIQGALARLGCATDRFLVCPGGFNEANADKFLLSDKNWYHRTSSQVRLDHTTGEHVYGNHLTMSMNERIANELVERITTF